MFLAVENRRAAVSRGISAGLGPILISCLAFASCTPANGSDGGDGSGGRGGMGGNRAGQPANPGSGGAGGTGAPVGGAGPSGTGSTGGATAGITGSTGAGGAGGRAGSPGEDGPDAPPDSGAAPDATFAAEDAGKTGSPAPCATGGSGFDVGVTDVALDRKSCLAWQRPDPDRDVSGCPLNIRDNDSKLCWSEATRYCAALRLDGRTDWRLPTIAELRTILVPANAPAVDPTIFPHAVLSIYWSSEKNGEKIVALDFSNAGMLNDHIGPDGPQALRCVRGPAAGR